MDVSAALRLPAGGFRAARFDSGRAVNPLVSVSVWYSTSSDVGSVAPSDNRQTDVRIAYTPDLLEAVGARIHASRSASCSAPVRAEHPRLAGVSVVLATHLNRGNHTAVEHDRSPSTRRLSVHICDLNFHATISSPYRLAHSTSPQSE